MHYADFTISDNDTLLLHRTIAPRLCTYHYPGDFEPTPLLLLPAGDPALLTPATGAELHAYALRPLLATLLHVEALPTLPRSPDPTPEILLDLAPSNLHLIARAALGAPHAELFALAGGREPFLRMLSALRDAGLVIYPSPTHMRDFIRALRADHARGAHLFALNEFAATETTRVLMRDGAPNAAEQARAVAAPALREAAELMSGTRTPLPDPAFINKSAPTAGDVPPSCPVPDPQATPLATTPARATTATTAAPFTPNELSRNPFLGYTLDALHAEVARLCTPPGVTGMSTIMRVPPLLLEAIDRIESLPVTTAHLPAPTAPEHRQRWPWRAMQIGDAITFAAAVANRAISAAHVYGTRTGAHFRTRRLRMTGDVVITRIAPPTVDPSKPRRGRPPKNKAPQPTTPQLDLPLEPPVPPADTPTP